MPEDKPHETEQPQENAAAREGEAEQATGGDAGRREEESQETAQREQPEAPGRPEAETEAAGPEAGADEEPQTEEPESEPTEEQPRPAAKDIPPGAELEPIAIEPERELSAEERARLEAEAEERARLEAEATREAAAPPAEGLQRPQRLENCGLLRAFLSPALRRSLARASRVKRPRRLRSPRSSGSISVSARARPWRTAPA